MPAEVPRFTYADQAFLPPSSLIDIATGADCGFLPPSAFSLNFHVYRAGLFAPFADLE